MSKMKFFLAVMTVVTLNSVVIAAPYTITDLGVLAETTSFGSAINNNSLVVGNFVGDIDATTLKPVFSSHAFLYDGATFTDIGTMAPTVNTVPSTAFKMNNLDAVVGYGSVDISTDSTPLFDERGFIYQNGVMQSIGIPANAKNSRAFDINDAGLIAGVATLTDDVAAVPVSYLEKAAIIDMNAATPFTILGTFRADDSGRSSARAINNSGQVVGWSDTELVDKLFDSHAFFYDPQGNATLEDLGTFGGKNSFANDINDAGVIVGLATDSNDDTFAFSFQPGTDTALVKLGVLNADLPFSVANDINDNNQVVGFSTFAKPRTPRSPATKHATLYENGNIIDLNQQIDCSLGWSLVTAKSINNAGEIVGSGVINTETHGFLLTPNVNGGAAEQCPVVVPPDTTSSGGSLSWMLLLFLGFISVSRKR